MDDLSKADGWASFFLGLVLSAIGGLAMFFRLAGRVDSNEKAITVLENNHDKRLLAIEQQIATVRHEVRQDIKDVGDRTDKGHERLENLLNIVVQKVK